MTINQTRTNMQVIDELARIPCFRIKAAKLQSMLQNQDNFKTQMRQKGRIGERVTIKAGNNFGEDVTGIIDKNGELVVSMTPTDESSDITRHIELGFFETGSILVHGQIVTTNSNNCLLITAVMYVAEGQYLIRADNFKLIDQINRVMDHFKSKNAFNQIGADLTDDSLRMVNRLTRRPNSTPKSVISLMVKDTFARRGFHNFTVDDGNGTPGNYTTLIIRWSRS